MRDGLGSEAVQRPPTREALSQGGGGGAGCPSGGEVPGGGEVGWGAGGCGTRARELQPKGRVGRGHVRLWDSAVGIKRTRAKPNLSNDGTREDAPTDAQCDGRCLCATR